MLTSARLSKTAIISHHIITVEITNYIKIIPYAIHYHQMYMDIPNHSFPSAFEMYIHT